MLLSISKKLKLLRTKMNMNQFEFSQFLSIKQPTLSAYERDITNPSLDVLLMIAEKCNVSLDWLCGLDTRPHFYTIADVILSLLEINKLDGLKATTEITKDSVANIDNYSCSIAFDGKIVNSKNYGDAEDNPAGHLCKFLYDWNNTAEQLSKLTDEEIKKNYYQMWLDKQLQYYSAIPIKTKSEKMQEQIDNLIGDHKLNLEE